MSQRINNLWYRSNGCKCARKWCTHFTYPAILLKSLVLKIIVLYFTDKKSHNVLGFNEKFLIPLLKFIHSIILSISANMISEKSLSVRLLQFKDMTLFTSITIVKALVLSSFVKKSFVWRHVSVKLNIWVSKQASNAET